MTKKQYLSKLRRLLFLSHSRIEAEDILYDYQSFFEEGLKSGETESELCEKLGSPRDLALKLRKENHLPMFSKNFVFRMITGVLFLAFNFGVIKATLISVILIALSFGVFWFLLGGGVSYLPAWIFFEKRAEKNEGVRRMRGFFVLHLLTFVFTVFLVIYYSGIIQNPLSGVAPRLLSFALNSSIAFYSALAVFGLWGFIFIQPYYYSLFCHAGGALYSAIIFHRVCTGLSDVSQFVDKAMLSVIPYIIGVFFAVLFTVWMMSLERRCSK